VIVVDASAVLAVFLQEPDAKVYAERLGSAGPSIMSAVNYWEVLVKARLLRGEIGEAVVAKLLADLSITIVPATEVMARDAAAAFDRFHGRPGGRLNLGDCFAYALAAEQGDGLLYKGNDFPKTDVKPALP
jgi:ribonuclease VapC